jgi:hypothetical protein
LLETEQHQNIFAKFPLYEEPEPHCFSFLEPHKHDAEPQHCIQTQLMERQLVIAVLAPKNDAALEH